MSLSWGSADLATKIALATPHRRAAVIGPRDPDAHFHLGNGARLERIAVQPHVGPGQCTHGLVRAIVRDLHGRDGAVRIYAYMGAATALAPTGTAALVLCVGLGLAGRAALGVVH